MAAYRFCFLMVMALFADVAEASEREAASLTPRQKYEAGYRQIVRAKAADDTAQALGLIRSAVDDHYVPAYTLLGTMLSQGGLVERDVPKAVELLEEAAVLGDATAMNNLAVLYFEGEGIARDRDKARRWATEAEARGITAARGLLKLLDKSEKKRPAVAAGVPAEAVVGRTGVGDQAIASMAKREIVSVPAAAGTKINRTTSKQPSAQAAGRRSTTPSKQPAAPSAADFYVQIASVGLDDDPEAEWRRLLRLSKGSLGAQAPIYQVTEPAAKNRTVIRILLGPHDSREAASAACRGLVASGVRDCLVRRD